jgi:hypothetical protein
MALYPLQPGQYPLGQFDVVDTELTAILGGEVMTFTTASRTNTLAETAAPDALDGYTFTDADLRPASTRASLAAELPLYLADDGTSPDYLTYFGSLTGPLGLGGSESGTVIGPHSASGSGKVTLWDKPGLFAISVSALAADFLTTLIPNNLTPGDVLGFGNGVDIGKLAHASCANSVAGTGVGHFVEFSSDPSLVTTPNRLVGAAESFTRLVLQWTAGNMAVRTVD